MKTITLFEVGDEVEIKGHWREWKEGDLATITKVGNTTVTVKAHKNTKAEKDFCALSVDMIKIHKSIREEKVVPAEKVAKVGFFDEYEPLIAYALKDNGVEEPFNPYIENKIIPAMLMLAMMVKTQVIVELIKMEKKQ